MTNEKITAMPVKKTQIHLTATLSLPLRLHERAWILTGSGPCLPLWSSRSWRFHRTASYLKLKTPFTI